MDINTPRRVTRASMAALSASKNSTNLVASSLGAEKTPTTGKRGRPRKGNIPDEVDKSAQKIARKILHSEPIPEIRVLEATILENATFEKETGIPPVEDTQTDEKELEQVSAIVETENLAPEVVDLAESPVVIPEKGSELTPEILHSELIPEIRVLEATILDATFEKETGIPPVEDTQELEQASAIVETEILAPEVVDLAESPVVIPEKESEPTPETANLAPETIILEESPVIATTEDDYLAKLCAESGVAPKMTSPMSETNNETIDMEETAANDTFEIKDSVFGEDISAPTPAKSTETSTIVIEDTPLKPKTPQITMRRPFRRQQNLEMPDALSVSCIGEKSILKRKKRSLSTGDIRVNMTMQERRVKFHSPANQTVHINEIDDRLLKSFTETNDRHQRAARRKRSLSDADYTLLKKENSAKTTFKSKKMPDFASIHSKQINKMESIADNLARKQERAMALTTPDRKKAPSDTKNDLSTEVPFTSTEIASSTILTHISEEKIDEPKQKVEENAIETEQIEEQPAPVLDSEPNHKKSAIPKPMTSIKPQKSDEKPKKPLGQIQFKAKIQFATERKKVEGQKTPVFNFAARSAVADIKRGKENGLVKPVNLVSKLNSTTQAAGGSLKTHIPMPSTSQTATKAKPSREERHKNLYKANKLCKNGKEGGKGLLQGVRLNKRFELQMAYRNMKKE